MSEILTDQPSALKTTLKQGTLLTDCALFQYSFNIKQSLHEICLRITHAIRHITILHWSRFCLGSAVTTLYDHQNTDPPIHYFQKISISIPVEGLISVMLARLWEKSGDVMCQHNTSHHHVCRTQLWEGRSVQLIFCETQTNIKLCQHPVHPRLKLYRWSCISIQLLVLIQKT